MQLLRAVVEFLSRFSVLEFLFCVVCAFPLWGWAFGATGCFGWPMSVLPNSREDALVAKEADFKEAQHALKQKPRSSKSGKGS